MAVREVLVFIHGVTPKNACGPHTRQYAALHQGIAKRMSNPRAWNGATLCEVEWGWDLSDGAPAKDHRLLCKAQQWLSKQVKDASDAQPDFTLNPVRLVVHGPS